ncbi:hypothetical protein E2562_003913 [Oryza meyeriana var. granulata]|uniref:Uncharacterized protein n=1 Tax=Oryza meyeriana var. granulata TaxID=110450 RepID=A0A6G1CYR1_9ORYZ|nr:hypothetical protein E2562_003913 [Oryza meyeriana var. granulata]
MARVVLTRRFRMSDGCFTYQELIVCVDDVLRLLTDTAPVAPYATLVSYLVMVAIWLVVAGWLGFLLALASLGI